MFTHLLPSDDISFHVEYSGFAKRHFLKRLRKSNPGKRWDLTEESIFEDISRISYATHDLQQTQQVDELWHKGKYWIFKYDFKIAGTKESAKTAGNRCVLFLDNSKKTIEILLIFGKDDLPKNKGEMQFIEDTLMDQYPEYISKCR